MMSPDSAILALIADLYSQVSVLQAQLAEQAATIDPDAEQARPQDPHPQGREG